MFPLFITDLMSGMNLYEAVKLTLFCARFEVVFMFRA